MGGQVAGTAPSRLRRAKRTAVTKAWPIAHLAIQPSRTGITSQVDPQDQRVDEKPTSEFHNSPVRTSVPIKPFTFRPHPAKRKRKRRGPGPTDRQHNPQLALSARDHRIREVALQARGHLGPGALASVEKGGDFED